MQLLDVSRSVLGELSPELVASLGNTVSKYSHAAPLHAQWIDAYLMAANQALRRHIPLHSAAKLLYALVIFSNHLAVRAEAL